MSDSLITTGPPRALGAATRRGLAAQPPPALRRARGASGVHAAAHPTQAAAPPPVPCSALTTQPPSPLPPPPRQVNECGPMHIIIGDAGNVEGVSRKFMDVVMPKPAYCSMPLWYMQFPVK